MYTYLTRKSILGLPQCLGIYQIRNKRTGWRYIGSSRARARGVRGRIRAHIGTLERGRHASDRLQRDWEKYGPEAFVVRVLEKFPEGASSESVLASEQTYLDKFGGGPGCRSYNSNPGAGPGDQGRDSIDRRTRKLADPDLMFSHNTSGYKGVEFDRRAKTWRATLNRNNKGYRLGCHTDAASAAKIYREAREMSDEAFYEWLPKFRKETESRRRQKLSRKLSGCDNPKARFSASEVRRIRALYASGAGQGEIARLFKAHQGTVWKIVRRKSYKEDK